MDYLRIAARVSSNTPCEECDGSMLYDDGRDAFVCNQCGNSKQHGQSVVVAAKKRKPRPKRSKPKSTAAPPITNIRNNVLRPSTEYSCQCELTLSADFEGTIPKGSLSNKLRAELTAAIKQAITITANDMNLRSTGVSIQPIKFDIAVNDQTDIEDEIDG